MKQYRVTGMTCAACQSRVEKAVSKVPGVKSCSVSLLTNSLGVEGDVGADEIQKAVEAAGYGFENPDKSASGSEQQDKSDALKDTESPKLRKRFLQSLFFLAVLMYFSMGPMLFHAPVPKAFSNPGILALTELLLSIIVLFINKKFFISGFKSAFALSPNMDTLVALGSTASFLYSLGILYGILYAFGEGNIEQTKMLGHHLYFETAAMIPTLITFGKMLEAISKGRTTDALKSLMNLSPKKAHLLTGEQETEVSVEEVKEGDLFTVYPGEQIPVDGIIVSGTTAVDESALTGESLPVDKGEGDNVSAGTLNRSGFIKAKASRVGKDTTLSQIIQMVSDAAATKAPIARIADQISGIFVPAVIGIAILTFVIILLSGGTFSDALSRAVAVLVISCPFAFGLGTPGALIGGNGGGGEKGAFF